VKFRFETEVKITLLVLQTRAIVIITMRNCKTSNIPSYLEMLKIVLLDILCYIVNLKKVKNQVTNSNLGVVIRMFNIKVLAL
jgi:hypothetical protein